ncbi:MAG: dephospho-CoA kinase, partial [Desulfovibrionaceae bacterium]|nr:dephospho-CoA kinase [Desulfovibrionaceae bacterium]
MDQRETAGGESLPQEKDWLETEGLDFTAAQPRAERLDRLLQQQEELAAFSREKLKQAVLDGLCLVDGEPCADPSRKIRQGQRIIFIPPEQHTELAPSHAPVDVTYEDADIAVVNKPAGLTVHPCPSCTEETLIHRLLGRFPKLAEQGGLRPGIVHRLDKDTSGLMLVALSERTRLKLIQDFAGRKVHKTYLALVRGLPPLQGQCAEPIGRHPQCKVKMAVTPSGREALTEWKRLYASEDGRFSLLALRLHTGRTHQIRVHMQHEGYPLLGDALYGAPSKPAAWQDPAPRQMLHAWRLSFSHPVTGEALAFACPPPEDFWETARLAHRRMTRLILTGCPGCGKSAFLRALEAEGVPVWSSDAEVKRFYAPGGEVASVLKMRYGSRFIAEDGSVSKAALSKAMKEEPGFRASLEGIVHPLVGASRERFFAQNEA